MDYESLEPEVRSVALVGSFLQQWAAMESALNSAIGKALNLSFQQTIIVSSNVMLRDKIHILRTAVSVSIMTDVEKARFNKTLIKIGDSSNIRNMMAHDLFTISDDGKTVDFYVFKAKGKLNMPVEKWSVAKFKAAFVLMDKTYEIIGEMEKAFGNAVLIGAMLNAKNHRGLFGLGGLDNSRANPPLTILDLIQNPASPETGGENSPKDEA